MLAKQTRQHLEWHDMEVGLLIHINMETYAPDWNYRSFKDNPESLDTDQWMHAAKAIGVKYAVLVA